MFCVLTNVYIVFFGWVNYIYMVLIDKYRYDFWWIDPWENKKSLTQQFQVSPWDYV